MKWLNYISILLIGVLTYSCDTVKVSKTKVSLYDIQSDKGIDSNLYHTIQTYKAQMDKKMNQVISYLPEDLTKEQPSCNIGNMMADIIYNYYLEKNDTLDLAVMNQGGIRTHFIPKGSLTIGNAFEIMPFENKIVQLDIPGTVLLEFMEHIVSLGGWPISHGEILLSHDNKIKEILINGQALDTHKMYRIATNDYIASGGDQCSFLMTLPRHETNILLRDVVIQSWEKEQGGIHIDNTKRIRYE
ncbi:MAG: 5'-nucleotidase C-terminal domain-containing protein [Chitinophagales bacterium]|nr:5'-nucleotidase C-terminal domain-containing protein [Chitinophagales bacterium]